MATSYAQEVLGARARSAASGFDGRVAFVGALVCVAAVAVSAASSPGDAAFGRGLLELLIVGVPIAVGLYALREPANKTFGVALLAIGFLWSLTALTTSSASVPHTIGRLTTWLILPCVVWLLLAFPHGRIERGLDRGVLVGFFAVWLFLYFGTAPFVQGFPAKTLWSTCTANCPANALFVLHSQPKVMTQVILVREWLIELLWLGLVYSMFRRWRVASPLRRRAIGPAFVAGTLLAVAQWAHLTTRQLGARADLVIALSSVWTVCIVAVCAAFFFGLIWRRMLLGRTLGRVGGALRASDDRVHMLHALRTALGDATTELLFRDPGTDGWRDAHGRPSQERREPVADRAITAIDTGDGRHDIALVHDVALLDDRELLDGVSGMVLANWRHERLTAELGRAMTDLEESRRRIAEAADLERVRIERDLHDGAQQRLVALRIRLGLAEELLETDPGAGVREVHELGFEAERALDELRSLAHGVYPALLTDRGLPDALRSVGARTPLPVHVAEFGVSRYPIEIESAVYFTCVEALQNAVKHAAGATAVSIKLRQTSTNLRFEIRDDGPGFTLKEHAGRGLRNMHDRIEAIGGEITVEAELGHGTRVVGSVQLP
jgi:signal transduction histidine kinase